MAEVEVKEQSGKGGKVRSKKSPPHVDLTPMVDLAFLLITFFMLVTTFNKPNVMDLGLPAKPKENQKAPDTEIKLSNSISILLGKDDKVYWHQQDQTSLTDATLNETNFDREGIRKVIRQAQAGAADKNLFTVIIKPTDDAAYRNFVDILDEMAITKNERYGVTDPKTWELDIYKRKSGTGVSTPADAAPQNP